MGFPLGLINKKSGVALSKKNDPIFSVEANAYRIKRSSSLEDIDHLKTKCLGLHVFQYWMRPWPSFLVVLTKSTKTFY